MFTRDFGRLFTFGVLFTIATGLYLAVLRYALQTAGCAGWIELNLLQLHAAGRLRPAEVTLFPPAHRWRCRRYRRVGITPLPSVPVRAVCPHRDLTRTAAAVMPILRDSISLQAWETC